MSLIERERQTVTVGGIELAYVERGEGDPLVLIMGLGADASAWDLHLQAYDKAFRCFAVDNRGAGASSRPEGPYSTAQMADDYAGLICELGLGAVRVVGISMGGAIAQELALRHPDLVSRMVIVSSWARCDEYAKEVFRHFVRMREATSPEEFAQLLDLWIWTPEHLDANFEGLRAQRSVPNDQPQHAFAAQCEACIGHDALHRLGALRVPTLITAGDRDIFTPLALAEELHRHIPDATLEVFPGAGHAHHWERLDAFNRRTTDWLGA
ncbi:MAG: alpha/beta hydrolase [Conexibacter sp.]|nr:alpha/beta hydrolase [Conexibacter sp.]